MTLQNFRYAGVAMLAMISILFGVGCDKDRIRLLDQPGQTWIKGRGAGHTIRFLDSGRYVAYQWCDICSREYEYGRWVDGGGGLVLRPDNRAVTIQLLKRNFRGCDGLLEDSTRKNKASLLPTDFYFREKDECAHSL